MLIYAQMGDPNASSPTPQPVYPQPQFAAYGRRSQNLHELRFQGSLDAGIVEKYGLSVRSWPSRTPARSARST